MKLVLATLLFLSFPITSEAHGLLAAAEEAIEYNQADYSSEAERVEAVQSPFQQMECEPKRGTYGNQRCHNIRARIQQILRTYQEDSDESLRSLGYEGPNASLGRELRELRREQEKWDCRNPL